MFKKNLYKIFMPVVCAGMILGTSLVADAASTPTYNFDKKAYFYGNLNRSGDATTYSVYLVGAKADLVTLASYAVGKSSSSPYGGIGSVTKKTEIKKGSIKSTKKITNKYANLVLYNGGKVATKVALDNSNRVY